MVTHEKEIALYAERAVNFLDGRIDNVVNNGGLS
jgi:ABC-type lipoprotein export system ATPase subunit